MNIDKKSYPKSQLILKKEYKIKVSIRSLIRWRKKFNN